MRTIHEIKAALLFSNSHHANACVSHGEMLGQRETQAASFM
jgi:hypothetical protein